MRKIFSVLLLAGLLVCSSVAWAQTSNNRTITVAGNSDITVMPNQAQVNITIRNTNKDAKVAASDNARTMQRIQTAILGLAIPKDEIKTNSYELVPEYTSKNDGSQQLSGYTVENGITVYVNDLAKISSVIDKAISAGATTVDSINFGIKDEAPYRNQALVNAVNDARQKAEMIATTLGKNIINVDSVSMTNTYVEGNNLSRNAFYRSYAAKADSANTPIQANNMHIKASVSVVFELND